MRRQPYHVDTLLQLSEVFKMQEDYDVAADLIGAYRYCSSHLPLFPVIVIIRSLAKANNVSLADFNWQ